MPHKLIVLMLDGVSADYFATERGRLPHLDALAENGLVVQALKAEVCGTSLPGRVSMLTGATAEVSGVYGNKIWDGTAFRYATPDDVRVPTVAALAKAAGHRVANIGFGMIRPEDADLFLAPWWVGTMIQRARDPQPEPASAGWLRVIMHQNHNEGLWRAARAAGLPTSWPTMPLETPAERAFFGLACDQLTFNWVGALAVSDDAPEFIISEVLSTDVIQHYTGYKSENSHWVCAYTDMLVGLVVERLRRAGKEGEYNLAVMSDHGHSPIDTALFPEVIIPGATFQSEGSLLHVAPKDSAELSRITEALAAYGVTVYNSNHVPTEFRDRIVTFAAPERTSFEYDPAIPRTEPSGRPVAISSHGLIPGAPGDDRFAVFYGPDVPKGRVPVAAANQVAPTFAALLGLPPDSFNAESIFETLSKASQGL